MLVLRWSRVASGRSFTAVILNKLGGARLRGSGAFLDRLEHLAIELFVNDKMAQASACCDHDAETARRAPDRTGKPGADVVAATRGRGIRPVIGVQQHRNDGDETSAKQSFDDETVGMTEAGLVRILDLGRSADIDIVIDQSLNQFEREVWMSRKLVNRVRHITLHHRAGPARGLWGNRPFMREYLVSVENRRRGHIEMAARASRGNTAGVVALRQTG